MNFSVDKDHLVDVLAAVQRVADRRHTMPVLSHALMTVNGDTLTVVSSDLEIVIRCLQPVSGSESGSVALPAKKLFDVVKRLDSTVKVSLQDGNYVQVTSGEFSSSMPGLPASDFPEMPEKPTGKPVSVDSELFCRLVESVVQFASADETRYNLAGVLLENSDGALRMVATDGHRLAMAEGEAAGIGDLISTGRILAPKKGILEIAKLAESGPGSIELSASEKFLFASKGDTEIWVRLLDADFPDYRQVIPKDNPFAAMVKRDAFANVLWRVIPMSPDKLHSVKLSLSGKQLEISTSQDGGEAKEPLEVDYDGPALKIGFNGKYLQDAVAGIREEKMVLQLKDEVSQVILRPEKDTTYISIVMPMRI